MELCGGEGGTFGDLRSQRLKIFASPSSTSNTNSHSYTDPQINHCQYVKCIRTIEGLWHGEFSISGSEAPAICQLLRDMLFDGKIAVERRDEDGVEIANFLPRTDRRQRLW